MKERPSEGPERETCILFMFRGKRLDAWERDYYDDTADYDGGEGMMMVRKEYTQGRS